VTTKRKDINEQGDTKRKNNPTNPKGDKKKNQRRLSNEKCRCSWAWLSGTAFA
jgi:hypothetical protein